MDDDNLPFLSLPAELRNYTYGYAANMNDIIDHIHKAASQASWKQTNISKAWTPNILLLGSRSTPNQLKSSVRLL